MKTYELADKLAAGLAEKLIAANFSEMMIEGGQEKAKKVRELSDANTNQMGRLVQEYRRERRTIMSAVYSLIEGYEGYKLVEIGGDDNDNQ